MFWVFFFLLFFSFSSCFPLPCSLFNPAVERDRARPCTVSLACAKINWGNERCGLVKCSGCLYQEVDCCPVRFQKCTLNWRSSQKNWINRLNSAVSIKQELQVWNSTSFHLLKLKLLLWIPWLSTITYSAGATPRSFWRRDISLGALLTYPNITNLSPWLTVVKTRLSQVGPAWLWTTALVGSTPGCLLALPLLLFWTKWGTRKKHLCRARCHML